MRTKTNIPISILTLLLVWVAGCTPGKPTFAPTRPQPTKTATPVNTPALSPTRTPLQPTPTRTITPTEIRMAFTPSTPARKNIPASDEPTATPADVLPPQDILVYRPFEINTGIPADVKPGGALLVYGESPQVLHSDPPARLESFPGIDLSCLSTSPDGKWVAYCSLSEGSPTGEWLMVESADRQQHFQIAMNNHLIWFNTYEWLDNQHLIFPLIEEDKRNYSMMVINPFTGKQVELASNYPEISHTYAGPVGGQMSFEFSDVVYDPSLNLAIYPVRRPPHAYVALWDRQSGSFLAEVKDKGEFIHYPIWSPDAQQFAVAVSWLQKDINSVEEWFSVSREGQVEQLTHFVDYFYEAGIGWGNWSPDGKKLAFWLEANPAPGWCAGAHLAVLKLATKQVTDTCIPGKLGYSYPPVWSLDSRYIGAVNNTESTWQSFLVDFEGGRAFDITEYGIPIGWLALP
jgi:WD40-like Beta Propeller Repeat